MKEVFYLDKAELPTIPVPHDCGLKDIRLEDDQLVFEFEDDISWHDSIQYFKPEAKSLIIRFHFADSIRDAGLYIRGRHHRLFYKPCKYRELDFAGSVCKLVPKCKRNLEYLYHYVGYRCIIVKLWSADKAVSDVILELPSDYVEYEWLM